MLVTQVTQTGRCTKGIIVKLSQFLFFTFPGTLTSMVFLGIAVCDVTSGFRETLPVSLTLFGSGATVYIQALGPDVGFGGTLPLCERCLLFHASSAPFAANQLSGTVWAVASMPGHHRRVQSIPGIRLAAKWSGICSER